MSIWSHWCRLGSISEVIYNLQSLTSSWSILLFSEFFALSSNTAPASNSGKNLKKRKMVHVPWNKVCMVWVIWHWNIVGLCVIHNSDYGLGSALVKLWKDGTALGCFLMVIVAGVRWLVTVNLMLTLALLELG